MKPVPRQDGGKHRGSLWARGKPAALTTTILRRPARDGHLSPGQHTFTIQALDSLGLVGPRTAYRWTIDTTAPDTTLESHPDATITTDSARFSFSSTEPGSQFVCRLDTAPYRLCDTPTTFSDLGDGPHTFRVAAIDRAGNGDPTPDAFSFEVHTIPAGPTITSGPAAGAVSGPKPSFGFSAQYASSFQCRFDTQAFAPCSGGSSHTPALPLADGPHTFAVRGIGGTGTPGPITTRNFIVDATPPATTITGAPSTTIARRTASSRSPRASRAPVSSAGWTARPGNAATPAITSPAG